MAPALLILGVFVIIPIFQTLYFSLFDWTIGAADQEFLGLGNYGELFQDDRFWNALGVTVLYTAVSVILLIVLGFISALLLERDTLVNRIVRSTFFFPTIVSLASIGIVWRFLLDPNFGFVGGLSQALGFDAVAWLQTPSLALPTVN